MTDLYWWPCVRASRYFNYNYIPTVDASMGFAGLTDLYVYIMKGVLVAYKVLILMARILRLRCATTGKL